jgi:hypothetical protein
MTPLTANGTPLHPCQTMAMLLKKRACYGSIGKDCGIAEGGLHELTTPSAMLFARANMGRNE